MYLYVAVWWCDPVIHYSRAFSGVCGVELIKPSETLGLCRAPATPRPRPPLLGCTLMNLAAYTHRWKRARSFHRMPKESHGNANLPNVKILRGTVCLQRTSGHYITENQHFIFYQLCIIWRKNTKTESWQYVLVPSQWNPSDQFVGRKTKSHFLCLESVSSGSNDDLLLP